MSPTILSLPNELLLAIAESLSPSELLHFFHVNQRFNHLLRDLFIDVLVSEEGPHGALFWGIALKDQSLVETVLQRCGEGVHVAVDQVATDPQLPVCGGDERLIKFVMDLNVGVEVWEGGEKIGPLLWAVRNGRTSLARMLVSNGFYVDTVSWGYYPPHLTQPDPYRAMLNEALIEACKIGEKDAVEVMLEPTTDSDIEAVGADNLRPLQQAVLNNHLEVVEILLTKGAQAEACMYKFVEPYCAIDMAIKGDRVAMWKLMLRYVNVEFHDYKRRPALLLAAETGDLALVKHLLDKGTFLTEVDVNGRTALHIAAKNGWANICKVLLEEGADTEARDNLKRTPLHEAAGRGAEAIQVLVEAGADVTVADASGRTPLHLAARNVYAVMEDLDALQNQGAELDVKDNRGRSPRGDMQTMTSARIRRVRTSV